MAKSFDGIGFNEILSSGGIMLKFFGGTFFFGTGLPVLLLTNALDDLDADFKFSFWLFYSITSIALGVYLIIRSLVSFYRLRESVIEKRLLKVVEQFNGIITAGQLANHTRINLNKADKLLRKYQLKGIAEIDANEKGAICFKFHDLMTP